MATPCQESRYRDHSSLASAGAGSSAPPASAPPPSSWRQAMSETNSSTRKSIGPGLRAMRFRRANCSISRKSASSPPGPDSTAPPCRPAPPHGLGVGVAEEAARGLLDGGPHGRAGRREQRSQLVLLYLRAAAPAPPGDDPLGPQQHRQQAPDLVEGLPGDLAHEIGDGPQQGAEHQPHQDPGQHGRPRVDQQRVDGAGLVDLVRGGRRTAHAVDGAALTGGRLGVSYDRLGGDENAVTGGLGPPAQVDVVTHQGQPHGRIHRAPRRHRAARACRRWTRTARTGRGRAGPGPVRGGPGRSSGGRSWRW